MKYEILLFDVDNTLLDFDANEAESFKSTMGDKGIDYTEDLFAAYKTLNHQMWQAAERGELTVDEVIHTRFAKLLAHYDLKVDGSDFEKTYRAYLNKGIQEMPHVHEVLQALHKAHQLYVITNGLIETQTARLKDSGLSAYFEKVFISEAIGATKPSAVFFNHVKENIPGFDPQKALIIGDSLTADIKGGHLAGIDTCWICKEGTPNTSELKPNYIIHSLTELLQIVK